MLLNRRDNFNNTEFTFLYPRLLTDFLFNEILSFPRRSLNYKEGKNIFRRAASPEHVFIHLKHVSLRVKQPTCNGCRTHLQPALNAEMSGTTHNILSSHLYIVSASTSPNHTRNTGVKFSPVRSNMATSPPPFS